MMYGREDFRKGGFLERRIFGREDFWKGGFLEGRIFGREIFGREELRNRGIKEKSWMVG